MSDEPPDRDYVLQFYVVCLMDVLGQSERLKGWERLPLDGQPSDQLVKAFGETAIRVQDFGTMFNDHFTRVAPHEPSAALVQKLTPTQLGQWARMREAKIFTRQFSDTFLFFSPLVNSHGDMTGAAIDPMLVAAALGLLVGLAKGTPPRGAIVLGAGTEIEEGDLYGPVLAAADRIEKKLSGYPRVVVSPEVLEHANRNSGFSPDAEMEAHLAKLQSKPQAYLCTDTDGLTIVDFLGPDIYSLVGTETTFRDLARDAYRFAQSEARRFTEQKCAKLGERYVQLLEYMRSRVKMWGIQP